MKTSRIIASLIVTASAFAAPALAQSQAEIRRALDAEQTAPSVAAPSDAAGLVGSPTAGIGPSYVMQETFGERTSEEFGGVTVPLRKGRAFRLGFAEQFSEIGQYDRPAGDYADNLSFYGGRPRFLAKIRF